MARGAGGSKLTEMLASTPYLFQKQRLASFKKFIYDLDENAVCTSEKLAHAGFYSTSSKDSPSSAKCPFCSKELEFDPEDDPLEEHKKRGQNCPFIRLNKLDDSTWTTEDVLRLTVSYIIEKTYNNSTQMLDSMENAISVQNLCSLYSKPVKKANDRLRRAK